MSDKAKVIGLGVACAACCAVPIGAVLLGGSVFSASLFTGQRIIIVLAGLVFIAVLVRYVLKRRKKTHAGSCDLNCSCKDKAQKGIC